MESTQSLHREASQSTLSIHVEPKQESVSTATPLLDLKDATLIPQGWPTSPSRIKHPVSTMLLHGALDIALFASSACFLVFSLVVMHYNDALTSENPTATSVLTRATKYGPTIFPLLFASVIGRATHAILLWRLEKGERIQILDTLATSTSLTATVTSQIQLRQLSVLSALLIVIWALSPIGGQASLRQMSVEMMLNRSDSTFRYVVPGKMFSHGGSGYSTVNNLFVSALYASPSTNASTVDLWGNVKIPRIEHYEDIAEPDSDGWFETRLEEHYLAAYTSFVGITIDGAQNKTTTTDYDFHLQTEYFHLACSSINDTKTSLPPDARNVSGQGGFFWWSGNDMENRWNRTLETLKPFNLSYNPGLDSEGWKLKPDGVSCSVKNSYVEVEVLCALNSTCRAVKVRRSQLPQLSSALTFMDFDLEDFMAAFMSSIGGKRGTALASPLGNYLTDPSLSIAHETIVAIYEDPKNTKISDKAWSERIGQLLNSYWTCAYGSYSVTGGILNATSYFWDTNITFVPPKVDFDRPDSADTYNWTSDMDLKTKVWSTQGNKTEHIEVIVAHKSWAITLAIASLVLIAFSIVTLLVRHFLTNGPDIAMNFSSLATRNNNHVPIPAGGSFLPASDRFRLLKDLRLRFADAEGKSDVGNLVIAAQGIEKAGYSRVRKGRLYE